MALYDRRLRSSVDLVQHWVNSLPSLDESSCQPSPQSCSSTSLSSTSPENSERGSCPHQPDDVGNTAALASHNTGYCYSSPISAEPLGCRQGGTVDSSPLNLRRRKSQLSWMHSNYSSFNSECSSIDLLLEERKANPEQVLMNLGFGVSDQSIGVRLPARFLAGHTNANGISMQSFMSGHPELGMYHRNEPNLAMGELYSRLPTYYRQMGTTDSHTTLHKKFSQNSLDLKSENSYLPLTVHKGEDGTMFASILTKSNTEQLAKQGFYSEHSSQASLVHQSSISSISTHDCTIDSVDTPSPIILNNSPSSTDSYPRNPFISNQSSLSDSVFSSTESYTMDQRLRAKLEAIQEKTLNEMCDDDLEEGISFVYRRKSDSDLVNQPEVLYAEPDEEVNIHEKRKAFARMKSQSFDEERLTQMLRDQLEKSPVGIAAAPVIVTTHTVSQEDTCEPVIPKQADGLLQVSFNPESFDSIDSDTGTLVPSTYASPYQGMSPNTSRNGSISVIPAMESFELEEIQSCDAAGNGSGELQVPLPTSKRKRTKLQRSVSERSDSDSSGIADVDGKSSHGKNDSSGTESGNVACNRTNYTTHLTLPTFSQKDGSISSSNQTLNSIHTNSSVQSAITCIATPTQQTVRLRRSSESDASDLRFYSTSSTPSSSTGHIQTHRAFENSYKDYSDVGVQVDDYYLCSCCGHSAVSNQTIQNKDWQINNMPPAKNRSFLHEREEDVTRESPLSDQAGESKPGFYILTSDTESNEEGTSPQGESAPSAPAYTTDNPSALAHTSQQDQKVDEMCTEMARDLTILRELFEKYDLEQPQQLNEKAGPDVLKQEIVSSIKLAKGVLSPENMSSNRDNHSIHSEPPSPFAPISVSCHYPDGHDGRPNSQRLRDFPDLRGKSAHRSFHMMMSYPDEHLASPISHRHGSVGSTANSRTPSSISSSRSRLSEQLKLTERKSRYEKQIADLEIQKYKLTLQMKDEEIDYWKNMSEHCSVD